MKRSSFVSLLLIPALTISALTGCGSKETPVSDPKHAVIQSEDTSTEAVSPSEPDMDTAEPEENAALEISYETFTKSESNENDEETFYFYYLRPVVKYPAHPQVAEKINSYFSDNQDTRLAEAVDQYLIYECSYYTKRTDGQIISFGGDCYTYEGDNKNSFSYMGVTFDALTGEVLTLDSIASDPDKLRDSARSYILNLLASPRYQGRLLYEPAECVEIVDNYVLTEGCWYVTNAGITFVANNNVLTYDEFNPLSFTVPYRELDSLKPDYKYTGPFEMVGCFGTTLSADIDNDGDADEIYYDAYFDETEGFVNATLAVNGEDYSNLFNSDDCWLTDGATYNMEYYLIDLDTSDDYIELAILDNGPSDDPVTYFFRYKDFDLQYMGYVPDLVSSASFHWTGDGTFSCPTPMNLLMTLDVSATYEVKHDEISLIQEDWYEIDNSRLSAEMQNHNIMQPFSAYTDASKHSTSVELSPADGPVRFLATDNKHWVRFTTSDGSTYYLYMVDFVMLDSGQEATGVFENLPIAG